jgi:hypothetical protein
MAVTDKTTLHLLIFCLQDSFVLILGDLRQVAYCWHLFHRMSSKAIVQQYGTESVYWKNVYKKLKHNKMWHFRDDPVCGSKPQSMQGSNGILSDLGSHKIQKNFIKRGTIGFL